jgi:hypothetical protein
VTFSKTHIALVAALPLGATLPQTASGCAIENPICTTPSTGLAAQFMLGSDFQALNVGRTFLVFQDVPGGKDGLDLILLDCDKKTSLVVGAATLGSRSPSTASRMMEEAMESQEVVTFAQLRKQLRAEGYASRIHPVPADHCACNGGIYLVDNSCATGG